MQVSASAHTSLALAPPPGFTQLYAEHYDFLWRCAMRLGTPPADLEDVVQECFVIALRRFHDFDPSGRARSSTWLFGILRNVQRNHARATRRRHARLELLAQTSTQEQGPSRTAEASLAGRLLDDFLATLDDDKRAAFVLAEIEGMTGPELAEALEINQNTATSRVRAARQAFARYFDEAKPRSLVEAEVERLAGVRAPRAVRRRGLPIIAALAGTESLRSAGVSASAGGLASKLSNSIAALMFGSSVVASVAIVASGRPEPASEPAAVVASAVPAVDLEPSSKSTAIATPLDEQEPEPIEPAVQQSNEPTTEPAPRVQRPKQTALQVIADARTALQDGDPARALAVLEHQRFPAKFEGRRIALEVAALCRLDRQADAESRARSWRSANANDPIAAELIGVCWSE